MVIPGTADIFATIDCNVLAGVSSIGKEALLNLCLPEKASLPFF